MPGVGKDPGEEGGDTCRSDPPVVDHLARCSRCGHRPDDDHEVVPKRCYREGDTRSKTFGLLKLPPVAPPRTLPQMAISNGKPFHPPRPGCGSDGRYLRSKGSN